MPATDSPAVLVARFLKANHYDETLDAFSKEAGLSYDSSVTAPGDWTIEKILEEKKQYDVSLRFEKTDNEKNNGWTLPAPSEPSEPQDLGITSNILCVNGDLSTGRILVTGADRSWQTLSDSPPFPVQSSSPNLHGSPILSVCPLADGYVLSTSMSGQVLMHHIDGEVVDKRRDHLKYAVQVAAHDNASQPIVATAGWDQKVHIYTQSASHSMMNQGPNPDVTLFGDPMYTITLPSNPESMVFVRHPDTGVLYLILSRRDSTHLYYYSITNPSDPDAAQNPVREAGRQNLAPHSNAWVAFTPSCLSICPTDPTLLAVATSHLPHMKLIVVRLLFPDVPPVPLNLVEAQTRASVTRSLLAIQDREDAAIRLHVSTLAPQTPYSTPQVVWRPDGTGVWVTGDDGAIRGIEMQSGKVITSLKGHEVGTKVRTLWAGKVGGKRGEVEDGEDRGGKEVLVSGGFDKKVFVWMIASDDT